MSRIYRNSWTEEQTQFLRDNYYEKGPAECGSIIGRTSVATKNRATLLGIKSKYFDQDHQFNRFVDTIERNGWTCSIKRSDWHGVKNTHYPVKCHCGYEWVCRADNVLNAGYKCKNCAGKTPRTVRHYTELGKKLGGKWSGEFLPKSAHSKTVWTCPNGHKTTASYSTVQYLDRITCKDCNSVFIGQKMTQLFLERLTGLSFESQFLDFLRFRGKMLQLDGYNEKEKIAFEYNGRQHYEVVSGRYTAEHLEDIKKRDAWKIKRCEEENIRLLIINEKGSRYDKRAIKRQILAFLKKENIGIIKDPKKVKVGVLEILKRDFTNE